MKVIGVTGGIGSGKSIVCKIFSHLGIPVYEADKAAHRLYEQQALIEQIREKISAESVDKNGKINRKKLSEVVFNDPAKLDQLNKIVHPAVQDDFIAWKEKHGGSEYVIKEAAILFESGAYRQCDKTVTVSCPVEIRINRIRDRDHKTKAEIEQIMSRQLPEEERISKSDYVIYNDEKQLVIPQVLALHFQFTKLNS